MSRVATCTIRAHATVAERAAAVGALRDGTGTTPQAEAPSLAEAPPLPARFLRHADEHTVVGVRAVQQAMRCWRGPSGSDPAGRPFERFGVVAATCRAGRPASAHTLVQYRDGGGVTVSPHIVPQCSLHATASAVSVGLGMHGPNIGVGGGPEAIGEGVLAALSILAEPGVSGCWLVLTAWDEEPALDDSGAVPADAICRAVAIGLDRSASAAPALSLRFAPVLEGEEGGPAPGSGAPLAVLAARLGQATGTTADGHAGALWTLRLSWGATVTLHAEAVADRRHSGRRAA